MKSRAVNTGFTLLEVLLVIAIIAILAGIVIVAINPARQLTDARNTQRQSDVNAISSAIIQYSIKNSGQLPAGLRVIDERTCDADDFPVKTVDSEYGICSGDCGQTRLDELVTDNYILSIPVDPTNTINLFSGYTAFKDSNNRVTVCAPLTEGGINKISSTR